MNGNPVRHTVIVRNSAGFHMRPITSFAELANKFQSNVLVGKDGGDMVNGKSGFLLLGSALAEQGTPLILEVQGSDAAEAMEAFVKFFDELVETEP
jgi:phosphocarrier protein HPr